MEAQSNRSEIQLMLTDLPGVWVGAGVPWIGVPKREGVPGHAAHAAHALRIACGACSSPHTPSRNLGSLEKALWVI